MSDAADLRVAMDSPHWDDSFWDLMGAAEERAKGALLDLYDAVDGGGCDCDTCVVRTVLSAVWPTITGQVDRLLALNAPAQTFGGGCRKGSECCRVAKD